jgi:hypothetical protein
MNSKQPDKKQNKMKHFKLYTPILAALMMMAACSTDDCPENPLETGNRLKFYATIGAPQQTRATGTTWEQGDAIGVYALISGTSLPEGIYHERANIKYTTSTSDGLFQAANEGIYFMEPTDKLDFVAYYPYRESIINYSFPVNVADQSSPSAIDLLYSNNAVGADESNPLVNLNFKHMLSQLLFTITPGEGVSSLEGLTVTSGNLLVDGSFDLRNGTFTAGNTRQPLNMRLVHHADGSVTASAILPPGQDMSTVPFSFTVNGMTFRFIMNEIVLAPTTQYSYQLNLSTSGLTALNPNATISDWIEGNPGGEPIDLIPDEGGETPVTGTFLEESFASGQGDFTIYDVLLPEGGTYVWKWDNNGYMKASGYIGGAKASEGWLISPAIDLSSAPGATLTFDHVINYAGTMSSDQTLWISSDYTSGNPSAASWTQLTIPTYPAGNNWTFVSSGAIAIPAAFIGQSNVHIAFKYLSSTENAATWEIKNLLLNDGTTTDPGTDPGTTPVTPGLLFAGSDFEDWSAFLSSLNSYGLKNYALQADGGMESSKALSLIGDPLSGGNDYVFTATVPTTGSTLTGKSRIQFYVKGTSAKSLSINIYKGTTGYHVFNLGNYNQEAVVEPTTSNSYTGTIDTGGAWMKVTLNISGLTDLATTAGNDMIALKIGKDAAYNLLLDNLTVE